MILKFFRKFLGLFIQLIEIISSPRGITRDAAVQEKIDLETSKLKLYQFAGCPFCAKVRHHIKKKSLKIELRDASEKSPTYRQELLEKGGLIQVPCLRIEEANGTVKWLYESDDIMKYLDERFV